VIRYDPRTAQARARLLRGYNDIDVFVEDITSQNLYVRLLSRILGPRRTISSVIALDGRRNVIEQCERDQAPRNRPRIYIIDGDLELLNGVPKRRLRHLYRLNVYCSENLVATEHAAILLAQEGRPSATYAELQARLKITDILLDAERKLRPLFVLYAIVQRLGLTIRTSADSVIRFLGTPADPMTISPAKIRARIRQILRQINAQVPRWRYRRAKRAVRRNIHASGGWSIRFISGKTYIQPLIELQLKRHAGVQDTRTTLSVRLASHCEVYVDLGLARALKREVRGR
jgi:hypothetical protein